MIGKIGIVTVLYKSESVLPEFFESLEAQTYKNVILYIVDNKSPDNSLAISEAYKKTSTFEVVVIANNDNYGVAKGNNIGIKRALAVDCDYVLLANNDITFKSNTIQDLLTKAKSVNADLSVPKIHIAGTNLIWFAGGKFLKRNGLNIHIGYLENDNGQYDKMKQIDSGQTCFMLTKSEVFNSVGLMDENYFVYWDDTDFIHRARKQGKSLWYLPSVVIKHKEGTSTGVRSDFSIYYLYRNLVYFTLKNRAPVYATYVLIVNIVFHFTKNLIFWNFKQWKIGISAYRDGFKLFYNRRGYIRTRGVEVGIC